MPASQSSNENAVVTADSPTGQPLIFRFLAVLLLVAIGSGVAVGFVAWDTAGEALEAATRDQLKTARAIKGRMIGDYFRTVEHEVSVLAMLPQTSEAIETFERIFKGLEETDASVAEAKMQDFISNVFMAKYESETGNRLPAASVMTDRPASLAVQAAYLADNPNPLGSKHLFESSGSLPDYDRAHERFHPIFRELLKTFGYYDIFLVDRTGEIIYSVYKETDFGTNLLSGPFKNSGLADSVRGSLEARSSNAFAFADFSTYTPSYEAPAAFVSRPVYAGETLVGVVAVQLPIDEIDEVMTGGRRWADEGFGVSGEAYLVGPDRLMRSDARVLIEDPEAFIRAGRARGVSAGTLREMERLGRTVLLERVENDAVISALEGQAGDAEVLSYDGALSVASFQSIPVFDQTWALIAEVDRSEAYAAADAMRRRIMTTGLIVLVLVVIVSIVFGQRLTAPISRLHAAMVQLQAGDFSVTVPPGGGRELTSLAMAYNRVAASLGLKTRMESANQRKDELIDEIAGMTATQASSSIEIMGAVTEISAGSREIAKTSEELTRTMSEVDGIASENAIRSTAGLDSLHRIETVMTEVVVDARNVSEHLGEIERRCESMGQVVTTMVSIADRTQILSINATMEAEKAGDAGLGFRVVAREVRRLADRTAESAAQIEENVKRMLASVDDGVRNMNVFQRRLDETAATNADIAEGLTEVIRRNQDLSPRFATVLESMKAQRDAARQISEAMSELSDNVGTTSDAVKQVDESIVDLREMASRLTQEISDEERRLGLG
jgi:methyl-accepting chemotaxis protein